MFLLFTVALASLGWYLVKKSKEPVKETDNNVQEQQFREANKVTEATWDDVVAEDLLAMEVGYRLIPLVDNDQQGELLGRIRGLRKNLPRKSAICRRWCISVTTSNWHRLLTGS